jgi:hypothetical protein
VVDAVYPDKHVLPLEIAGEIRHCGTLPARPSRFTGRLRAEIRSDRVKDGADKEMAGHRTDDPRGDGIRTVRVRSQRVLLIATVTGLIVAAGCTSVPNPSSPAIAPRPSSPATAPSALETVSPSPSDPFEELARRQLAPSATVRSSCPVSVVKPIASRIAPASGAGPTYAVLGAARGRFDLRQETQTSFGRHHMKTLWVSTSPRDERLLVRVARLTGAGPLPGFAAGDVPDGDGMPTQLRLGPEGSVVFEGGPMPEGWRAWSSATLVAGAGCYAFQVDSAHGSETIVFEAFG